jgi:hypothetical protein
MAGTRRFDRILSVRLLKPGTEYLAWKCKNEDCEQPIAPDQTFTAADPDRQFGSAMFIVKCPHCGLAQDRVWAGLERMAYTPRD